MELFSVTRNHIFKNYLSLFVVLAVFTMASVMPATAIADNKCHKRKYQKLKGATLYKEVEVYSVDGSPHFPGVNSKTQRLFVSDVPAGTVKMLDSESGTILAETPTGSQTHTVAVDEKNNLVYTVNRDSDTLTILDGNTNVVIADVVVGDGPHGLDLDLINGRAFISNTYSNDVTVVDTATYQVIKTIPVGVEPWGVAYDAGNDLVYVSNTGAGSVWRIDPENGEVLRKFEVGGRPWNVKVSQKTGRAYATNETLGILSVMNHKAIIAELPIGDAGRGLVLNEKLGLAFAVATGSNQVTTVNMKNNQVVQNITVGTAPTAATLDVKSNAVYIANQGSGTISVLHPKRKHHN